MSAATSSTACCRARCRPARVQIYFFKTLIPIAGALVLIQGFAEVLRCIHCIRTGVWPERLADVEETETMLMHEAEDLHAIHHDNEAENLTRPGAPR